ncbi:prepilin peptidase [Halorubrum sp. DTA98]|uniref:A24 family peptidase n=1 Tax=Halorubrum sp. DTA98 TaxID=3402163 RepID=UPI003AAEBCAD
MFATLPDLLRLFVVPVFAWAALRDVRTRRLPNNLWPPLYAFGLLLLVWETARLWPLAGIEGRLFLVQAAISLLFVAPLGYAFWYLGAFGGADAKALIALALVFPTFPTYVVGTTVYPLVVTDLGVFSLTILTNTVLIGMAYPVALGAYNLARGERSLIAPLARPVSTSSITARHGRLFEDTEGTTRNGLDLDALRMYLRWRGITLADLRARPGDLRDPASVTETFDPTDGGTHVGPATDGGEVVAESVGDVDDPWAAERFLDEIDGTAYGTDPETLREGLAVVAERDRVWVSPGLPFVVPMFLGLVASITYGDALFALLGAVGLVA